MVIKITYLTIFHKQINQNQENSSLPNKTHVEKHCWQKQTHL